MLKKKDIQALPMQHDFLKKRAGEGPMAAWRKAAADRFKEQGWPGPGDEAWRFTNLNKLRERNFEPVVEPGKKSGEKISDDAVVVIDNGIFDAGRSTKLPKGVELVDLAKDKEMAALLDDDRIASHPIANLTFSVLSSGFGIRITGKAEAPLRLVFLNDGDEASSHPVGVIKIEDGAEAVILEHHSGTGTGLSAPLLAIDIGSGARLGHARVQIEDAGRHHLAQTVMTIGGEGRYEALSVQTGGVLSRTETHLALLGEDVDMIMTTIYLARDEQVMDVTTLVDHRMPSCTSRQIVRGVLDDKARGIFQGKVIVAQDAQKTDGNQMSRALLLSRDCEADAKPELEIYADDVVCSHGATVGEIDDDHLFYLTSRGIPKPEARQILIEAFLADVLEEVGNKALVDFAAGEVTAWLKAMKERS
jgi:Fe-S cluster assembly protein SufD